VIYAGNDCLLKVLQRFCRLLSRLETCKIIIHLNGVKFQVLFKFTPFHTEPLTVEKLKVNKEN